MQVKKCMALFASAAFAMLTLAGCGGSDHSELAARTVNEAQKEPISVEFITDRDLTQSLKDALKDTTDPGELRNTIQADDDLADLLTGAQIDVYTAGSQLSPEEAAQQIANLVVNTLSGKQDTGYITMVEAEDGTYYAITLVYGSGSGGSSQTATYNVTVTFGSHGSATLSSTTVKAGGSVTVTVKPDATYQVDKVTIGSDTVSGTGNTYTVSNINSDITINVTFKKCAIDRIEVTKEPDKMGYWTKESFDPEGMVVSAVYTDGNREPITSYTWTPDVFSNASGVVTISYEGHECELTVDVTDVRRIEFKTSDTNNYKVGEKFSPVGMQIWVFIGDSMYPDPIDGYQFITITQEMVDSGEVKFTQKTLEAAYSEGIVFKHYYDTVDISYRGWTVSDVKVEVSK